VDFFRLRSLVSSFGWEIKYRTNLYSIRPLNVELYGLEVLPGLKQAFINNPFLRTAFNTGYVVGNLNFSYNKTFPSTKRPHISNYLRGSFEESGLLLGRVKSLNDKIYQYLRMEGEFRQIVKFRKNDLAYRLFGGVGYNYGDDSIIGKTLPFFKQFIAGGPNSMRAWAIRQIGLGSSLASDTSSNFRDRYGDVQLEGNVEYRFPVTTISGVKVNSAVFADVGNIWNLKSDITNPYSTLQWGRFLRDLAIGVGTGVRLDFNYFLIRVDFAYKVKDPARQANGGWMSLRDFEWRNKEFTVIEASSGRVLRRNNYAIQLGIGLPF
jgi:outer membrane translocation and assembly module TamA